MQLDYLEKYKDKIIIQPNSDQGKILARIMEMSKVIKNQGNLLDVKKQENTNNKVDDSISSQETNLNNKENSENINNILDEVLYFYNKLIYSLEFYIANPNNIANNAYDIEKDIIYIEMSIEEKDNFINKDIIKEINNIINEGYTLVNYIESNDLTNKSYIEKVITKFKAIISNIKISKDNIIKTYNIQDSPYDPNWKQ
ncbi:hypothetical protein [Clostridium tarantellae]|uniref:Uncharacterized protein n=1 Tax=Clostridium tarantellae TaxID=39493 RepID=A0A6I1MPE3_9CLOT|nr:hypothetical protein [Clostridium tarantellae]MPQ44800.1 hypothetical protein [Clostridium tarantellae]